MGTKRNAVKPEAVAVDQEPEVPAVVEQEAAPVAKKVYNRTAPVKLAPTKFTATNGKVVFSCVATRPVKYAMLHAERDGVVRWISTRDNRFTEASCAAYYAKRDGLPVEGYTFVEATGEPVVGPVAAEA